MVRRLLIVAACSLAAILASTAIGAVEPSASAAAPRAHAAGAALSRPAAVGQMRAFLRSAVQVTAVNASFEIRGCRRRGARVLDCTAHIRGRSRVTMRARLLGKRNRRIQLYVLAVRPA